MARCLFRHVEVIRVIAGHESASASRGERLHCESGAHVQCQRKGHDEDQVGGLRLARDCQQDEPGGKGGPDERRRQISIRERQAPTTP